MFKKSLTMVIILLVTCFSITVFGCDEIPGIVDYNDNVIVNYQTGDGFCKKPENPNGAIFDITKCDNVTNIIEGNEYKLGLKIQNPGFYFYNAEDGIESQITAYKSISDLCNDKNGIVVDIVYYKFNKTANEIQTDVMTNLVHSGYPVFLVKIPEFTYNKSDINSDDRYLLINIAIINPNTICSTCDTAICRTVKEIGSIECKKSYTTVFPYCVIGIDEYWSGIAITNSYDKIVKYILNVYTPENIYTYERSLTPYEVDSFVLSNIMYNVNYSGNCWVEIKSSELLNGVCFFGNRINQSCYIGISGEEKNDE